MQNQNDLDLGDAFTLLLIIIAIILTAILIYIATRLIAGKKETESSYLIRLLFTAIVIFVVVFGLQAVVSRLGDLGQFTGIQPALTVIIFTSCIYIIKLLILPVTSGSPDLWQRSIWIALLTTIFIFSLNEITNLVLNKPIIPIFSG